MSPAGRPPMSGERKTAVLQIRLTDAEKATIDSAAAAIGQATGAWLRDLGLAAAAEIAASQAKPAGKKKAAKKG